MHYSTVAFRKNVSFESCKCGTNLVKDGTQYTIKIKDLCKQAKLANINFQQIKSYRKFVIYR